MKFKIRQNDLKNALNVIKGSKALGKIDEENGSVIRVSSSKSPNEISFLSSNIGVWAGASIPESLFEGIDSKDDLFGVDEEGSVFVDGNDFISMMSQYPTGAVIEFEAISGEGDAKTFNAKCEDPSKKGRTRSSSFLVIDPPYFEENPPEEDREGVKVVPSALSRAVRSVEFMTGQSETETHLWGVQLEIHGEDDISSCASDKARVVWYDKQGYDRSGSSDPKKLNPIKTSFVAAIKGLDQSLPATIKIGERYTIVEQENQWHGVPNAVVNDGDRLPEWRKLTSTLMENQQYSIEVSRQLLEDFIKTATSSSCGKYGISIHFDTEKEKVNLSINETKSGAVLRSTHQVEDSIPATDITGEHLNDGFVLSLDGFKEIVTKYKSDTVLFLIIDCHNAIQIVDENADFRYITSVVD